MADDEQTPAQEALSLKAFLEDVPPGQMKPIEEDAVSITKYSYGPRPALQIPSLFLHCTNNACDGGRFFDPEKNARDMDWGFNDIYLDFTCRNCRRSIRTIALRTIIKQDPKTVFAFKFGEIPAFGPPLPARLLRLAGDQADMLKKGRRSENQSLGIGAFAYYRRVVELQKVRLIDELKNALTRLGEKSTALEKLEEARAESQFSKALEIIADVIPKELYVSGKNPLTLLHGPLSVGLHALSDDECLKVAHNVRVVLSAMMEKIDIVTEQKEELDAAVKELLKPMKSDDTSKKK